MRVALMRNRHWCIVAVALVASGCSSERKSEKDPILQTAPTPAENAVRDVISELLKVDSDAVPMDKPLSDPPLNADELDLVEIVMELEDRQGIVISEAALKRFLGGTKMKSSIPITPNQLASIVRNAQKAGQLKNKK